MIGRQRNGAHLTALVFSMLLGIAGAALGEAGKASASDPKKPGDVHRKMAELHTKMAACLESSKTPEECRKEMVESCSGAFGGSCPMAGGAHKMGAHGPGAMGAHAGCMDWMLNPEGGDAATKAPPAKK